MVDGGVEGMEGGGDGGDGGWRGWEKGMGRGLVAM